MQAQSVVSVPWMVIALLALMVGTSILASVGLWAAPWSVIAVHLQAWRSRAAWLACLGVPAVVVGLIVVGIFSRQNMLTQLSGPEASRYVVEQTEPAAYPGVQHNDYRLGARPRWVVSDSEFAERVSYWANRRAHVPVSQQGTNADALTRPDVVPRADRVRWSQIVEIEPRPRPSANDARVQLLELESQWFATLDECEQRLTDRLAAAVLANFSLAYPDVSPHIALPPELLLKAACEGSLETEEKDFGNGIKSPMYRLHLAVALSPELRNSVFQVYRRDVVSHRIWVLVGVTAWVVSQLAAFAIGAHLHRRTQGKHVSTLVPACTLFMAGGMLLLSTLYM